MNCRLATGVKCFAGPFDILYGQFSHIIRPLIALTNHHHLTTQCALLFHWVGHHRSKPRPNPHPPRRLVVMSKHVLTITHRQVAELILKIMDRKFLHGEFAAICMRFMTHDIRH